MRTALAALYAFYRGAEPMLANVVRDAEAMPVLREVSAPWRDYVGGVESLLADDIPGADQRSVRVALALALDFRTWQILVRERGLDDADAAGLMTRAVVANRQRRP